MYSGPWELGLIISEDECDTALRMTQLNVDGNTYDVIYTTGYFSNTFNAYWTDDADGLWTDPSTVSIHAHVKYRCICPSVKVNVKLCRYKFEWYTVCACAWFQIFMALMYTHLNIQVRLVLCRLTVAW